MPHSRLTIAINDCLNHALYRGYDASERDDAVVAMDLIMHEPFFHDYSVGELLPGIAWWKVTQMSIKPTRH